MIPMPPLPLAELGSPQKGMRVEVRVSSHNRCTEQLQHLECGIDSLRIVRPRNLPHGDALIESHFGSSRCGCCCGSLEWNTSCQGLAFLVLLYRSQSAGFGAFIVW